MQLLPNGAFEWRADTVPQSGQNSNDVQHGGHAWLACDHISSLATGRAAFGKGFGCRRSTNSRSGPGPGAGVGKPPKNEPAGWRRGVGRLWGFGRSAALAKDHFAQIGESWNPPMMADRAVPAWPRAWSGTDRWCRADACRCRP